jgi:alkanesulfonate monooxygenase SsuD/methylene tetrahydromethanopterin reductase-like flavin-dependent oxidoreductase (luciferase family)
VFTLRFDMRAPAHGAPTADLYQAALEITAWAETRGAASVLVCEHHMSSDGYLPSPLPMLAALAARTTSIRMMAGVFLLPLYNPVRLAEEMCVIDILSRGRTTFIGAVGYRPVEYEMYGIDFHKRGALAEKGLALLVRALKGMPFEYEGRHIHVTPAPFTPGGPAIMWGGGSIPAARRAGRYGLGFLAQKADPELRVAYEEESRAHGHAPGLCILSPAHAAAVVFVADDLDQAWDELGPYLLHDVLMYGAWNEGTEGTSSISFAKTAAELRAENRSHRILTVAEAVAFIKAGGMLPLHPIIGGLPPKIAWRYLETIVNKVMPATQ